MTSRLSSTKGDYAILNYKDCLISNISQIETAIVNGLGKGHSPSKMKAQDFAAMVTLLSSYNAEKPKG